MEKEFIPFKQSLALKELGFNEPCIQQYSYDGATMFCVNSWGQPRFKTNKESLSDSSGDCISAPTFSQVFKWFREKYELFHSIDPLGFNMCLGRVGQLGNLQSCNVPNYGTYEETELACLNELIEIVKKQIK